MALSFRNVCPTTSKGKKWRYRGCSDEIDYVLELRHFNHAVSTRFLFNKGHLIRDSTGHFPKNKGQRSLCSTEPVQNKGQLEPFMRQKKFVSAKVDANFRGASRRFVQLFLIAY